MANETKTNYLAKLLTLLVKRESGVIKIPIQDLMVDDVGQGISVHFSQDTKELVITFVPAGATVYKIEGGVTWLNANLSLPQNKSPESRAPLSQEELVAKVWSESAATPTLSETRNQPPKNKVVHLTDATMAAAESEKRKREVLREIENYQSPQPKVIPSRPLQTFLKP